MIILPSARAISYEQISINQEALFLPNFLTMNEFVSKLCIVKDFKMVDEDTRVLLLLEASDFANFSSLKIERNFFTFTKNSSYIFNFFKELSHELYDISQLDSFEMYEDFKEHINVLQELYIRYEKLCEKNKILDKIFLPKLYTFNADYLKNHKEISIKVDGHLTNFEFELLEKCSKETQVNILFTTSRFNQNMQVKFRNLGIELEEDYEYIISFNYKTIKNKKKRVKNKNITCQSLSESLLQIAFIKHKLYEFIKKGYKAENIALILADEKLAGKLKSFDEKSNFNFTMGDSFKQSSIYEKLNASIELLNQKSKENNARLVRVGDSLYTQLISIYHNDFSEIDIIKILEEYKEEFSNKRELKIYNNELYSLKNILPFMQGMSVKSLLSLFLQRLALKKLDDIRGGKVTVMGILETSCVKFDAVIIVDFSDSNVPKKSNKDMFLNTYLRKIGNLPTTNDKENLQKHYYDLLISNSKEVAISYVNSSESSVSRFLKQVKIEVKNEYSEFSYAEILFKRSLSPMKKEKDIIVEYSFKDKKISTTRLKTFLTCKRKYYYKYIKHIYSHEIPKEMPKEYEIGNHVHTALAQLYKKQNSYTSVEALEKDLNKELENAKGESELDDYLISMQKKRLKKFCELEVSRFNDGWSVLSCEESFECNFAGATFIGNIDRVDKRKNEIYVLDYKTGSYPLYTKNNFLDAQDFQLEFYYLLSGGLGNIVGCAFYDLKECKIVDEPFLEEKLGVLEATIKRLLSLEEINFEKCEDVKSCLYCEYATICERN